jgi:mRNA-degrading endonuclease RelE of RelBE toxin-antitoxin system
VSAATQVYYNNFDAVFFKLAPAIRARVEAEIDRIGSRLSAHPHHRLKGSRRFRARVGDYRIIYTVAADKTRSICSPSAIADKFIGQSSRTL